MVLDQPVPCQSCNTRGTKAGPSLQLTGLSTLPVNSGAFLLHHQLLLQASAIAQLWLFAGPHSSSCVCQQVESHQSTHMQQPATHCCAIMLGTLSTLSPTKLSASSGGTGFSTPCCTFFQPAEGLRRPALAACWGTSAANTVSVMLFRRCAGNNVKLGEL